ncbi:MAG TPA: response regulator, partial [Verrucomicrobium sp.]|nr:response regulator [Verrucomicrobium sp.]
EVVTAQDGRAAWELLSREPIRVVVSDWSMPEMDGLELCSRIRSREGADYVYFILLTKTCASESNQESAHAAGVDDFLVKPLSQRDLRLRLSVAERIVGHTTRQLQ